MRYREPYPNSPFWSFLIVCKRLFFAACILIATFAVVGYAWGWIKIDHSQQRERATIEIDTGEIRSSADKAVEKTKDFLQETGDKLKN